MTPSARRRGIGSTLVNTVIRQAADLGVSIVYLFTTGEQNEAFYAKLGWSVRERVMYRGKLRVIMQIATERNEE